MGIHNFRNMNIKPFLFLLFFSVNGNAQVTWKKSELDIGLISELGDIPIRYEFTNTGNVPVRIKSLHPECGCTSVVLEKREFAPGESGVIDLVFVPGNKSGFIEKKVVVETTSDADRTSNLVFRVRLPERIALRGDKFMWKAGGGEEHQIGYVSSVNSKDPISKIYLTSSDATLFGAKVINFIKDKEWQIEIWPFDASNAIKATIGIDVTFASGAKERKELNIAVE